jgi:hypothetical protein
MIVSCKISVFLSGMKRVCAIFPHFLSASRGYMKTVEMFVCAIPMEREQ